MRDVSMKSLREPKGLSEHTRNELRTMTRSTSHSRGDREGGDRERGDKPVPGHEDRILHALTTPYSGVRRYAQDLAAVLPRKHMYRVRLARECVSLVHVDVAKRPETDIDRLHLRTRAHIVQESTLVARAYECRVRESVQVRELVRPQQCPRPELPTRCVLMVQRRGAGGHVHLLALRRRIGGDLALGGKFAGQTPDFLRPVFVVTVKDEIPAVVLAVGTGADVRLQATA